MQNVTEEETTIIGGECDESESGINRIEKVNRITDRNKHLTAKVKVNGFEKDFILDTASPISIMPTDENILKKAEIQKVKHRNQDVKKTHRFEKVNFRSRIPTDIKDEKNKQKKKILITERDDITSLLRMDWMKKIN